MPSIAEAPLAGSSPRPPDDDSDVGNNVADADSVADTDGDSVADADGDSVADGDRSDSGRDPMNFIPVAEEFGEPHPPLVEQPDQLP